jgi:hypothetical protein
MTPYHLRGISPMVLIVECLPGFSVLNSVFYLGLLMQGDL